MTVVVLKENEDNPVLIAFCTDTAIRPALNLPKIDISKGGLEMHIVSDMSSSSKTWKAKAKATSL
jgi:hypothetical protein